MKESRQSTLLEFTVFSLLVAIGVAGRWGQPEWCFTPTAAAAVFAGIFFSRWSVALLVPVTILLASDLLLPAYNSRPVMLATYAIMTVPVFCGLVLRNSQSRGAAIAGGIACSLLPATAFYIVTNFAVWAFQSNYEKSLAGLAQCYWAAVPFYRWMLCGDVFYLAVLVGCWALAGAPMPRRQAVPVIVEK
jgi:hypothetical protein